MIAEVKTFAQPSQPERNTEIVNRVDAELRALSAEIHESITFGVNGYEYLQEIVEKIDRVLGV